MTVTSTLLLAITMGRAWRALLSSGPGPRARSGTEFDPGGVITLRQGSGQPLTATRDQPPPAQWCSFKDFGRGLAVRSDKHSHRRLDQH